MSVKKNIMKKFPKNGLGKKPEGERKNSNKNNKISSV